MFIFKTKITVNDTNELRLGWLWLLLCLKIGKSANLERRQKKNGSCFLPKKTLRKKGRKKSWCAMPLSIVYVWFRSKFYEKKAPFDHVYPWTSIWNVMEYNIVILYLVTKRVVYASDFYVDFLSLLMRIKVSMRWNPLAHTNTHIHTAKRYFMKFDLVTHQKKIIITLKVNYAFNLSAWTIQSCSINFTISSNERKWFYFLYFLYIFRLIRKWEANGPAKQCWLMKWQIHFYIKVSPEWPFQSIPGRENQLEISLR